jgi:hypothetical protein
MVLFKFHKTGVELAKIRRETDLFPDFIGISPNLNTCWCCKTELVATHQSVSTLKTVKRKGTGITETIPGKG